MRKKTEERQAKDETTRGETREPISNSGAGKFRRGSRHAGQALTTRKTEKWKAGSFAPSCSLDAFDASDDIFLMLLPVSSLGSDTGTSGFQSDKAAARAPASVKLKAWKGARREVPAKLSMESSHPMFAPDRGTPALKRT
jgi:hypothetical protein